MMINPYCSFFNEERDDEYAPPYGMCELCYRYDICKKAEMQEALIVEEEDYELTNIIESYKNKACEIKQIMIVVNAKPCINIIANIIVLLIP